MRIYCENRKIFNWVLTGVNLYFLSPKDETLCGIGHLLLYTTSFDIGGGVYGDHNSSNRIKLSQLVQELYNYYYFSILGL